MKTLVLFGLSLPLVLGACGGKPKQADDAVSVSNESKADMGPEAPSASTPSSAGGQSGSAATAASTPPAASAEPPANTDPIGPITLKGTVSGGPFVPKQALINVASVGSSDVFITITDGEASCEKPSKPAEGERSVEVRLAWKPGSYDIASKKLGIKFGILRKGKALAGEATKGTVEVLQAPTADGSIGRIRVKASAPKETITGEIDVRLCTTVKKD